MQDTTETPSFEFQVGDIIEIQHNRNNEFFYSVGDKAKLLLCDQDGDWKADFNGQGNPEVSGHGHWFIGDSINGITWKLVERLT